MHDSDIDPTGVRWEKHTYRDVWEELSDYRREAKHWLSASTATAGRARRRSHWDWPPRIAVSR